MYQMLLSNLHTLSYLIFSTTLQDRYYFILQMRKHFSRILTVYIWCQPHTYRAVVEITTGLQYSIDTEQI